MNRNWQAQHRRSTLLRSVVAELERRRTGGLPWDDELAEEFGDTGSLLAALHGMWLRRLLAHVDQALERGDGNAFDAVASARREVACELAAVRRVLDEHADDPAVQRCDRNERRLLGASSADRHVHEA